MLDFSQVVDVRIPWYNDPVSVNRILDAQGRVVWSRKALQEPFYAYNMDSQERELRIRGSENAPHIDVQVSWDKRNWTDLGTTGETPLTIQVPSKTRLYIRSKSLCASWCNYIEGSGTYSNHIGGSNGDYFSGGGNIMSLLYGPNFTGNETTFPNGSTYTFCDLFGNMEVSSEIILPATTLVPYCYCEMFEKSTGFGAPELPATTLAEGCYAGMFRYCIDLRVAPELPATTLAKSCYSQMFMGCLFLHHAPELPATTLAEDCYYGMFTGCYLFTVPELPATTLAKGCYSEMFLNCESLTAAPYLPATTLAYGCYNRMFDGCTNLQEVKCNAIDMSAYACTWYMLYNVSSTGTFYKNANATWPLAPTTPTSQGGIPEGWTVVNL